MVIIGTYSIVSKIVAGLWQFYLHSLTATKSNAVQQVLRCLFAMTIIVRSQIRPLFPQGTSAALEPPGEEHEVAPKLGMAIQSVTVKASPTFAYHLAPERFDFASRRASTCRQGIANCQHSFQQISFSSIVNMRGCNPRPLESKTRDYGLLMNVFPADSKQSIIASLRWTSLQATYATETRRPDYAGYRTMDLTAWQASSALALCRASKFCTVKSQVSWRSPSRPARFSTSACAPHRDSGKAGSRLAGLITQKTSPDAAGFVFSFAYWC